MRKMLLFLSLTYLVSIETKEFFADEFFHLLMNDSKHQLTFCNSCPDELVTKSFLYQADLLTKLYHFKTSKLPLLIKGSQTKYYLEKASVWLSIDLEKIPTPCFETLHREDLWQILSEIGIEGVYFQKLKQGAEFRTGLGLDSRWGKSEEFDQLFYLMKKKGMILICDCMGNATGLNPDFLLALKNCQKYLNLYHLIEVKPKDWPLLPKIPPCHFAANVSWLKLKQLHKKGYPPKPIPPLSKQSEWNATAEINCLDGKSRRYIYLKKSDLFPVINWIDPSYLGLKIASSDILESIEDLNASLIQFDQSMNSNAFKMLNLWTHKLNKGSILIPHHKGIEAYLTKEPDFILDQLTHVTLLHALLTENATVIKYIYRILLSEKIDTQKLVHTLQPFDRFPCDWKELISSMKSSFGQHDEIITADALMNRLLKEDFQKIFSNPPVSWPKLCFQYTQPQKIEEHREMAKNLHLLLAIFYAMQPGVFSLSASDLLGQMTNGPINFTAPSKNSLYGSLPSQMQKRTSFANQLRKILEIRKNNQIELAKLIAVPTTDEPGLLILVHELSSQKIQLLAINFSNQKVKQTIHLPQIHKTTAIDLIDNLTEKKPLASTTFNLELLPKSAKSILFQPKYYD